METREKDVAYLYYLGIAFSLLFLFVLVHDTVTDIKENLNKEESFEYEYVDPVIIQYSDYELEKITENISENKTW